MAGILIHAAAAAPLLAAASPADSGDHEVQAIAAARRVDVHDLDAALSSQSLEAWLAGVVGSRASVRWEMNDCGEQTGNPANTPADFPICAEAMIVLPDERAAGLSLTVGTAQKGVSGQPALWHLFVTEKNEPPRTPRQLQDFARLLQSK